VRSRVEPDERGEVLLTVWQAAWLSRTSTETIRRWQLDGLSKTGLPIHWRDLVQRTVEVGHEAPIHWTWLNADLRGEAPTRADPATSSDIESEQAATAEALRQRDEARADAESLDQAVMAFRDIWRRRMEPRNSGDLS
jgi:hypothetical protein